MRKLPAPQREKHEGLVDGDMRHKGRQDLINAIVVVPKGQYNSHQCVPAADIVHWARYVCSSESQGLHAHVGPCGTSGASNYTTERATDVIEHLFSKPLHGFLHPLV